MWRVVDVDITLSIPSGGTVLVAMMACDILLAIMLNLFLVPWPNESNKTAS